ncbi:hypothetical protein F8O06_04880 [Pseudoclavibacter sp. CFCC 14310]|uniref:hypothetical protein n=1 Tax=Pseudoclavibacter sp. CFCC 14310 TaxID=2615180 RepID=UPI001300F3E5|nr:hypothetical protein [Pseudoclavibacter sp. CFCC 14310]KAB1645441.1 hypothetical protein F8O06_07565 [Pseudoclavibacter sp. CFCC 14310]KAB1646100.1 hypothetical protein F8O06_04880 [Pseudoclavibacter sp. CFCC 14310]
MDMHPTTLISFTGTIDPKAIAALIRTSPDAAERFQRSYFTALGDAGESTRVFGSDAMCGVIDGKQRIETMRAWASDEFSVPADWFDDKDITPEAVDSDGMVTMSGLSARGRRRSTGWPMPAVQTSVRTLAAEAEVFRLLNSAGTHQTDEDMAHAAHVEGH